MKFGNLLCIFFLLCSCGPREIGEGTSQIAPAQPEISGADMLRMPMTGMSNTEKMLYWQNNPDVAQNMQHWQREQFRRYMGLKPDPESPEYREIPKQKSPFRQ